MSHPLLSCSSIDLAPPDYLRSVGKVFQVFDTQDSGNISYGVQVDGERYFVKTAGNPDNPKPYLDHAARVALLRNAARLGAGFPHPILPQLLHAIESTSGPLLVYPWLDGELLGVSRAERDNPHSAFQRFRRLPAATIERCLDCVFDLHTALAGGGWIAVDFYDGALIYDFTRDRIWAVDLDTYSQGPFTNIMGRMFGSDRFMAPEEFELGALIDEQTTVFVMGRTALVFLSDGSRDAGAFRGSRACFEVAAKACAPERGRRYVSMDAFHLAWRNARTGERE